MTDQFGDWEVNNTEWGNGSSNHPQTDPERKSAGHSDQSNGAATSCWCLFPVIQKYTCSSNMRKRRLLIRTVRVRLCTRGRRATTIELTKIQKFKENGMTRRMLNPFRSFVPVPRWPSKVCFCHGEPCVEDLIQTCKH